MSKYGNIHDFLSKIEWEGGVYEALDYGLTPSGYELPQNVTDAWWEIMDAYESLAPLIEEFWKISDAEADRIPHEED